MVWARCRSWWPWWKSRVQSLAPRLMAGWGDCSLLCLGVVLSKENQCGGELSTGLAPGRPQHTPLCLLRSPAG